MKLKWTCICKTLSAQRVIFFMQGALICFGPAIRIHDNFLYTPTNRINHQQNFSFRCFFFKIVMNDI